MEGINFPVLEFSLFGDDAHIIKGGRSEQITFSECFGSYSAPNLANFLLFHSLGRWTRGVQGVHGRPWGQTVNGFELLIAMKFSKN